MKFKKTKIIATLGPATNNVDMIEKMVNAGANVFRINTSHGNETAIIKSIEFVRKVENHLNIPLGILLDLQGPKIRVGVFKNGYIDLHRGEKITFTPEKILGDHKQVPVQYNKIHKDVKPGNRILLDDGNLSVIVRKIAGKHITVEIENGGVLSDNKGLNLPESSISASPLTRKDKQDLITGLKHGVDFIGLSFVRKANDIRTLRRLINNESSNAEIVAKIERHEAIKNFDRILKEADAIMVARGDLGVEIPFEEVPLVKIDILRKASRLGKPVIVATQMLESMINNHRPTRAEISDVANSVAYNADALMLSAETAVGKHPIAAVKAMSKTAINMEKYQKNHYSILPWWSPPGEIAPVTHGITYAANTLGELLKASAIIAFTEYGDTAKQVAKPRPNIPIFAFTPNVETVRKLSIVRGVFPFLIQKTDTENKPLKFIFAFLKDQGFIKKGDRVILTSGIPMRISGATNMIRVETVY